MYPTFITVLYIVRYYNQETRAPCMQYQVFCSQKTSVDGYRQDLNILMVSQSLRIYYHSLINSCELYLAKRSQFCLAMHILTVQYLHLHRNLSCHSVVRKLANNCLSESRLGQLHDHFPRQIIKLDVLNLCYVKGFFVYRVSEQRYDQNS
jgi:hypothetical protein